jgi:hypothetical protein
MRKSAIPYYVLLLLVVMGAFASMALNSYGTMLMSYAVLAFSLLFLYELFVLLREKSIDSGDKKIFGSELAALCALCILYFLGGMAIEIPYERVLVSLLPVILLGLNCYFLFKTWTSVSNNPVKLKAAIAVYFAALFLAWGASYLFFFQNFLGLYFTFAAFLCLTIFIVIGWWKGAVIVNGEETNAMRVVTRFQNKSSIQLIGIALIVAYYSLRTLDILPPLYLGSMPSGYANVVRQSEGVKGGNHPTATDPKAFEEAYKNFIKGK